MLSYNSKPLFFRLGFPPKHFLTLLVLFMCATRHASFALWDERDELWRSSWNIHFRVTSFPLACTRIPFYVTFCVLLTVHLDISVWKNQLDALFILSLFRQTTSTCFGHICSPSSGDVLYIYNNWYVLCFSVDCLLAGGQPAVKRRAQHVPIVVYIQYIARWWVTNMPKICRGWLTT
jgi:hypothetical protein